MKTPRKLSSLAGWTGRCTVALLALTICASAFADPSKNVVTRTKQQQLRQVSRRTAVVPKRQIFVMITGSAIPQPIDRIGGPIATTAVPMFVYGNKSNE